MKSSALHGLPKAVLFAIIIAYAIAPIRLCADQNLAGNVTVTGGASTGNLSVTGAIDSDGNAFTFGTQGASFGAALQYQDNNADTFTFSANRNPASWLWVPPLRSALIASTPCAPSPSSGWRCSTLRSTSTTSAC